MTTAHDIIQDSLELLQVYAPGEAASPPDIARGFVALGRMVDAWAEEKLAVTQVVAINGTLNSGQTFLSVQVPNFRQVAWAYGPGQGSVTVPGPTTTALNVVSAIEFAVLAGSAPGSGTPIIAWPDVSLFPFQNVNFAPTPNVNNTQVTINQLTGLASFASILGVYALGLGVQDALVTNLAIALKPYFPTAKLAPETMILAQETKNYLRYQNRPSRALLGRDRKAAVPKQTPVPSEAGT